MRLAITDAIGTRGSVGTLNPDRMWTGGVMMNEDGSVLSSGVGGIMWNHPDTGRSGWLIREIGGTPINGINEMITDGTGGIYFGTIDLEQIIKGKPTRPASLYRLTIGGEACLVADGLGLVNGIMLSVDRKRLYCNETFDATYMFDVMPDMSLANRRLLVKKEDCDGMALDADGNLWITGFRSSELTRAKPGRMQILRAEAYNECREHAQFGQFGIADRTAGVRRQCVRLDGR